MDSLITCLQVFALARLPEHNFTNISPISDKPQTQRVSYPRAPQPSHVSGVSSHRHPTGPKRLEPFAIGAEDRRQSAKTYIMPSPCPFPHPLSHSRISPKNECTTAPNTLISGKGTIFRQYSCNCDTTLSLQRKGAPGVRRQRCSTFVRHGGDWPRESPVTPIRKPSTPSKRGTFPIPRHPQP